MKAKKLFPDISFRRLVRLTVPVDNLESTDVDRPLSANMGREIKEQIDENTLHIVFDEPQRAISKGQAVVLYDGDYVVGGGTII